MSGVFIVPERAADNYEGKEEHLMSRICFKMKDAIKFLFDRKITKVLKHVMKANSLV